MSKICRRSRKGASLIDVLFGTTLLAVTISGATIGLNMSSERVRRTQERADLVSILQREIELQLALADRGEIALGTTNFNSTINRKTYNFTTTITDQSTAGNPSVYEVVATGTCTKPLSETSTLKTLAYKKSIGDVISVNYTPAAVPYVKSFAPTTYSGYGVGYYLQWNWNALGTALGTEVLQNGLGQTTAMRVQVTPSAVTLNTDFAPNYPWGPVQCIAEGMIADSANTKEIRIDITSIPYPTHNIVVYFGVTNSEPMEQGWIEIDGKKRIPITPVNFTTWASHSVHLIAQRTFVVLGPLTGSSHTIKIIGKTKALRFHGLQVANRT